MVGGHAAGGPPPAGPARRGPGAVPRPGEVPPRGGGGRAAHRRHDDGAGPPVHRAAHRRPGRVPGPCAVEWRDIEEATGVTEAQIRVVGEGLLPSSGRSSLGDGPDPAQALGRLHPGDRQPRPAAGEPRPARSRPLPVRGHSNVQGDRTMGIFEKMPEPFLDRLDAEFAFASPREHGLDTVQPSERCATAGSGSSWRWVATSSRPPRTGGHRGGLRSCDLTVQVSTKLNHSHVSTGRRR